MAWDDTPPTAAEMAPKQAVSWDSAPPSPQELQASGAPLPSSGRMPDSAFQPSQSLGAGDVLPNPVTGVLAGAALTGGGMAADSALKGDSASDVVQNGLLGAGASLVGSGLAKVAGGISSAAGAIGSDLVDKIPQKIGEYVGPATRGLVQSGLNAAKAAIAPVSEMATNMIRTAAAKGPQQAAIAHYLLSQRDPAYAAAQQKKGDK